MSKKNLLITAVLLVAIAAFVQLYSKRDKRRGDSPVGSVLASVDLIESINSITIQKGKNTIHLRKNADKWTIDEKDGFPADMEKLLKMLDNITSYKVASMITRDKTRLSDFNLTAETGGTLLSLKNGDNAVFNMTIGKNRESSSGGGRPARPDGTYVKIGDAAVVYLIKENLDLESYPKGWMKKVLFTTNKDDVKSLSIESSSSKLVFDRQDEKSGLILSGLANGETANKQPVTNLLEELESFEINDAQPLGGSLDKELQMKADVAVALADNSALDFQILVRTKKNPLAEKKEDQEELTYYIKLIEVKSSGDKPGWSQLTELGRKWLFEVDEWRAENWLKSRKEFIKSDKKS